MAYPGWLVCPGEKRRLLWSQHGIGGIGPYTDVIIDSLEALSLEKQLHVLREISWRYDICLAPMSTSLKQAADRILGAFQPFPKLEGFDDAAFSFSDVQHTQLDWPRIRESWVYLALSRMRAAREDFAEEVFDRWHEILEPVVRDSQDWACRLRYEACLAALCGLDQDSLAKQLKEWPEADNPPAWLTRKAALLAELGALDEAERVASAALSQIRSQQQYSREDDIGLMSEEAWAMILLEMIVAGKWSQAEGAWERHTALKREHRGRLRHLAPYFCDPWPDIERLRTAVTAPALRAGEEMKRGFDPWYYSKTYHLRTSGIDDAVLSAHSLIRLHEDGGFPMRAGNVTTDAEVAKNAARLVFIERPAFAVSLALRGGGSNSLEFLDRVAMAILPLPEVHIIFQLVYQGVTQAVKAVKKSGGDRTDPSAEFTRTVMSGAIEVLSRLAFRLPHDQLRSLLDLAVMLHESPNVQSDFTLHSDLANLFTRVLYSMRSQEAIEYLPTLLQLTIPGSEGSHVTLPDRWPEPVNYLDISGDPKSVAANPTNLLPEAALRTLINVLSGENLDARTRALSRILILRNLDLLAEDESKECARALWSQVDERTKLPRIGQGLRLSAILAFPETEKREHHLLREFLLETAIPGTDLSRSQERVVNSFPTPLMNAATRFLDSFKACSKPLWLHRGPSGGPEYIDWTQDEARQLVERAVTFWENEKYDLAATKKMSKFLGDPHHGTRLLFARFARVLFLHLVPRLVKPSPALRQRLTQVHEEMLHEDVPVLCTLPALLITETASERDVVNRIKSGLQSTEETVVLQAADSVYFWAGLAANSGIGLPSVPEDLCKEIIGFAEARRQPGLEFVLSRLAGIVRDAPGTMSDAEKECLCAALTDTLRETDLPTTLSEYFQEEALLNRPISASTKIEYQVVGADLASALYGDYGRRGAAIPDSLEAWKQLSKSSPLPEVRRAWQS
jgi:hypothetical protein